MTGSLSAFLAGDRDHSEAEVLGFDPNRYVLRLNPFAAVGGQYEARVKIAK